MARNDESQRGNDAPSRVYRSSDVHKRRVDRKRKPKGEARPAGSKPEGAPPVSNAFTEVDAAQENAADSAVVLAPEFGRRTAAQREADDRWFAAMREDDLSGAGAAVGLSAAGKQHTQPLTPVQDTQPAQQSKPAAPADDDQPAKPVQPSQPAQPGQSVESEAGAESDQPERSEHPSQAESPERPEGPNRTGEDGKGAAADEEPSKRTSRARFLSSRKARIALIVGAVVLVAAIVVSALFVWNRWYRFDDRADMQGTWYVVGTTVPVTIDETAIHLTDDVTYVYEINDLDKTISYTFGPMRGQGRYWFSDDRQYLVITDGDEFTGASTAVDDLVHAFSDMGDKVSGNGVKLPEGEGIIAFSREPDAEALEREQKAAAEKAAAEEAARKAAEEEAARIAAEEAAAWEAYSYYEEEPATEPPAQEAPAEEASAEAPPAE